MAESLSKIAGLHGRANGGCSRLILQQTPQPGAMMFVAPTRNERAMPAEQLGVHASAAGWQPQLREDVGTAIADALAQTPGRVLLVGSLFAVGEAMQRFGGAPEVCS